MNHNSIVCALFLLLAGASPFYAQPLNKEFTETFQKKCASISSITCQFRQTRDAAVLAQPVQKEGVFYFKAPQNILLSYNDGDHIIMTADWFEMKNGEHVNSTRIASNPMLKSLRAILSACMVGDLSRLSRDFEVSVQKITRGWAAIMKPKRGQAASKISQIVLHFEKKNMTLTLLKMEETSGDYTEYQFYDKQFNVAVGNSLFNISE